MRLAETDFTPFPMNLDIGNESGYLILNHPGFYIKKILSYKILSGNCLIFFLRPSTTYLWCQTYIKCVIGLSRVSALLYSLLSLTFDPIRGCLVVSKFCMGSYVNIILGLWGFQTLS